MTDTLIISEAKLRQFTDINDNLDSRFITSAVIESQDIHIQRIIGTLLYNKIMSDIDSDSLSGNYKSLVDDYIQPSLLYWSYYECLEAIYIRPRNNGLLRSTGGDNSESVDLTIYEKKRQSVKNKAEWYSEKLTDHLIEYQGNFPELTENTKLDEQVADFGIQFRSPIVMRENTYAPYLRQFKRMGMRTYDSRYPYLPQ